MTSPRILVVGAGPAGIAAASRASESGASVTVIDDNPAPGGQIWRGGQTSASHRAAMQWFSRLAATSASIIPNARVISADASRSALLVETGDSSRELRYDKLILATGARELFLPFPGWTLPGIMGAGGLQAMAKSGMPIYGKNVVVAGSGPLLLAVAAYLKQHGAQIKIIAEQAALTALARFSGGLMRHPGKLVEAARLKLGLAGVRYAPGTWVEAAEGSEKLQRVRLSSGQKTWTLPCDYAAIGYGLWPNTELGAHLGCRIEASAIAVDDMQRSSSANIFAAGECTGIGGVDLSLIEGEIAGYAACGREGSAHARFPMRDRARKFASALNDAFALRDELKRLPHESTIVCRCEDVTFARMQNAGSFRSAKLHTRCGMGPCQGRICGPATSFLFGWRDESVRPPILPATVAALACNHEREQEA